MECIANTDISEGDKLMVYTRIISLERIQKDFSLVSSVYHIGYIPKRTKLIFALAALKKDADEKRKTPILLFSPAFILKIQKKHAQPRFG